MFLAITDIEFNTVVGNLKSQEELPSTSPDIKKIIMGHRGETITMVGDGWSMASFWAGIPQICMTLFTIAHACYHMVAQPADKRAFRAYGAARDVLTLADSARFFYKVGGAAGQFEIGTVAVLNKLRWSSWGSRVPIETRINRRQADTRG